MTMNYIQKAIRMLIVSFFVWILGLFAILGALGAGWVEKDPALISMLVWSGLYAMFVIGTQLIVGARFWKDYGRYGLEE